MKNIKELREFLGETMKDLKSGKLQVEKAKAISQLGAVIVDTARAEIDLIKAAGLKAPTTDFINDGHEKEIKLPEAKKTNGLLLNGHDKEKIR